MRHSAEDSEPSFPLVLAAFATSDAHTDKNDSENHAAEMPMDEHAVHALPRRVKPWGASSASPCNFAAVSFMHSPHRIPVEPPLVSHVTRPSTSTVQTSSPPGHSYNAVELRIRNSGVGTSQYPGVIWARPCDLHVAPRLGHASHLVAPAMAEKVSSRHCAHELAPLDFDAKPFGHCVHALDPVGANQPRRHASQVWVAFSCSPAAHGLHSVRASFVMKPS